VAGAWIVPICCWGRCGDIPCRTELSSAIAIIKHDEDAVTGGKDSNNISHLEVTRLPADTSLAATDSRVAVQLTGIACTVVTGSAPWWRSWAEALSVVSYCVHGRDREFPQHDAVRHVDKHLTSAFLPHGSVIEKP
jgi:hypothetical protein